MVRTSKFYPEGNKKSLLGGGGGSEQSNDWLEPWTKVVVVEVRFGVYFERRG